MLDKILGKIKEAICIVQFNNTQTLIDTDDKLPDYITLKNVVMLIECVIIDDACQKMRKKKQIQFLLRSIKSQ